MSIVFKGYAVVSADGFIADAEGRMPECLRFEADWAYFQGALDAADLTLLGRHTHEAAANAKRRRRLVASRGVRAVIQENACTWWVNPDHVTPAASAAVVAGSEAEVAVVGGTGVFTWILADACYQAFHLSIAREIRLGAGRRLFDRAGDLKTALDMLRRHGLGEPRQSWLDRDAGLELLVFDRETG